MVRRNRKQVYATTQHQRAKQHKQFYENLTGDSSKKYSEFMRKENPLTNKIIVYDVSYQLNYSGENGEMYFESPETFQIYAIDDGLTEEKIKSNVMDSVKNSKGPTSRGFYEGTKTNLINNYLEVKTEKRTPRGIERSQNYEINEKILTNLNQTNGFFVKSQDERINISKKKGQKTKATMKTDLTLYFR